METYTMNQVIETLAQAIANKNELRAVIEYANSECILLDFSACGEPFSNDTIMQWSDSIDKLDDNGKFCGTDELDYGVEKSYQAAFEFAHAMLNKKGPKVTDFYVESF